MKFIGRRSKSVKGGSKEYWDQYQYLGNCPPTPPLTLGDTDIDPNIDCELTPNEDVSEEYFRAFGGGVR